MTLTRRLLSGTFQIALSTGITRLFAIAALPVLTTLLTPQAYGVAALAGTAISLVAVLALAGIDMSYARAYLSTIPPNGEQVERFCWRFTVMMTLPAAVLAGIAWLIFSKRAVELNSDLAILITLAIALTTLNSMSHTRARLNGRYRALSVALVLSGLITTAASIGIAALWRRDATAIILSLILGYVISVLILGTPSPEFLLKPSGLRSGEGIDVLKIGIAGVITAPMFWLLSSSDRWFLQHYRGTETVGIYAVGYSVGFVGMMVNSALSTVWLPEATREYEHDPILAQTTLGRLISRLFALMAITWLAVAGAGSDAVRWLANERFHAAAEVVPYVAGGIFFYGAAHLAMFGLLLAKQSKWAAAWWLVGGVICTILNFTLVPRFGSMGAAVTQTISFACICLGILLSSQSKYRMKVDWIRLGVTIAIILGAGYFMIPSWHQLPVQSLLLKFPFGVAVSAMVVWVIAPDWFLRAIGTVRRARKGTWRE